jgi:hypothetical protein
MLTFNKLHTFFGIGMLSETAAILHREHPMCQHLWAHHQMKHTVAPPLETRQVTLTYSESQNRQAQHQAEHTAIYCTSVTPSPLNTMQFRRYFRHTMPFQKWNYGRKSCFHFKFVIHVRGSGTFKQRMADPCHQSNAGRHCWQMDILAPNILTQHGAPHCDKLVYRGTLLSWYTGHRYTSIQKDIDILVHRTSLYWYTEGHRYKGTQDIVILVYRRLSIYWYTGHRYTGIQKDIVILVYRRTSLYWYTEGHRYTCIQKDIDIKVHRRTHICVQNQSRICVRNDPLTHCTVNNHFELDTWWNLFNYVSNTDSSP